MKVVVAGTGFVGSTLVREFSGRGFEVAAVARHPVDDLPENVGVITGSVHTPGLLESAAWGADVIVSALPPLDDLPAGVEALLAVARTTGARLGVVGGSAVLPLTEGAPRQADTPGFPAWLAPRARAHEQALNVLTAVPAGVDWFYLVPAAEFGPHRPGTRTGSYRTSTASQVTDGQGRSVLGVQDYAIAFADEIERPTTRRRWLAVGY
ncbi:NAD(P)H-binding protein [Kineosporia mesophila]|uniref:NAD(P)H-binding protein n=1 Tax=Kineosporia mesophila TaxID=566012 RepID=A0ABP7ASB9_9ACTN